MADKKQNESPVRFSNTDPIPAGTNRVTFQQRTTNGPVSAHSDASSSVSDTAYGSSWNGVTSVAPSKNAVYDKVETIVSDTAYGSGWNGDTTTAPSKNAVYDKIETLSGSSGATELDYVEITSDVTINGSSGSQTTIVAGNSVSYNGTTKIIISFFAAFVGAGSNTCTFELFEDSTSLGRIATVAGGSGLVHVVFAQLRRTPSNASHTYTVKAWKNTGTDFALGAAAGTYLPAFIRITTTG